jgi:hypothetical protein
MFSSISLALKHGENDHVLEGTGHDGEGGSSQEMIDEPEGIT